MAKRRLTAEQIVHAVQLEARRAVIERAGVGEAEIVEAWAPLLEQLRDRLATAQRGEVQTIVNEAVRELARAAVDPIRRSMRDGSVLGMRTSETQHERLTAPGGPVRATARQRESFASPVTRERAVEIAQERASGAAIPDRVRLSTRLYRNTREAGDQAARIVRSSIDARVGITEAADAFVEAQRENIVPPVPRYIERITEAARIARDTGDQARLMRVIESHTRQMNALGEGGGRDGAYSIRSTVRQFTRDVQMRPEDIERLLAQHMSDRMQVQARRLVRNETAEAMRASYLESVASKPYVKGIRWRLSPAHPRPDVCFPAGTVVETGLGPKAIETIEVGDLVLTHRGRHMPVTRLYRTTPAEGLLRLRFQVGTNRVLEVDATPNHPFATARGWIQADDLRAGDLGLALVASSEALGRPRGDGTRCTCQEGSRRSEPCGHQRTNVEERRAGPLLPAPHTDTTCESIGTRRTRKSESGSDRFPLSHRPTPDCLLRFDRETSERVSRPAFPTSQDGGARSSDCPLRGSRCPCTPSSNTRDVARVDPAAHRMRRTDDADTRACRTCDSACAERKTARMSGTPAPLEEASEAFRSGALRPRTDDCRTCAAASLSLREPPLRWEESETSTPDIASRTFVESCQFVDATYIATTNDVYNIEVEEDHTYFAGEVLVHNCDLYAAQALHGLGPGGYPLENVPETPHPMCLCLHESIIDEQHFTRRLAEARGDAEPPRTWEDPTRQSAHDWLAERPESFQRQILGPTRLEIFRRDEAGRRAVIDDRGRPIPVGEVLARLGR